MHTSFSLQKITFCEWRIVPVIIALNLVSQADRVVCPNFGHPALTSSFYSLRILWVLNACYKNNNLPFENWNNFKRTVHSQLFQNYLFNLYFVNDEVRVGCPKLGDTLIRYLPGNCYCFLRMKINLMGNSIFFSTLFG